MKKTIKSFIAVLLCFLLMVHVNIANAQEAGVDEEATATQTDAIPQNLVQSDALICSTPNISLNDIQTLDMGRYVIVGVNQPKMDNVYYRWMAYDFSKGYWTMFNDWTTATCVFWHPSHPGDYNVYVQAMCNGQVISSFAELHYFAGCTTTLHDISFNCTDQGCMYSVSYDTNDTELKFRWQAYDVANGTWQVVRDWSSDNYGSWKPEHSGDYFLRVEAKGGDGKSAVKLIVCHVDAPHITSFEQSLPNGFANETITLKGTYSDAGTCVGKVRYLVYNGKNWIELEVKDGQAQWCPTQVGDYLLCYEIDDNKGNCLEQRFQAYNVGTPYARIRGINIIHGDGLQYTFQADVNTNDAGMTYRWLYYDVARNAWGTISDWSNTGAVNWTADGEKYYWIQLQARQRDGNILTHTEGLVTFRMAADQSEMLQQANQYSSATNYLLMVNGATHKVGVFTGSQNNWTLQYYWDCADGKPSTPTVRGQYTVAVKGNYFDSGEARCFYYTQFYGNYLFHSVLYDRKSGALSDGRVGMALSHGCVRLKIENAKWIYDNIPSRTKVVVYN